MSDLVAWVKDQLRRSGQLKELIKTHTGLAPPAFVAVVALAAAGTALTLSAVSSLFAAPQKSDKALDAIIEEEIMPYTPSNNQRELDVIPVVLDQTPVQETEEEAPANEVEAPKAVEAPVNGIKEKEVEAPVKTEKPATVDGEDSISSDYVEFEETVV